MKTQFLLIATLVAVGVPAASACTGIRIKPKDGFAVIFARTPEFAHDLQSNIIVIPRGKAFVGTALATNRGFPGRRSTGSSAPTRSSACRIHCRRTQRTGSCGRPLLLPRLRQVPRNQRSGCRQGCRSLGARSLPPRQLPKRPGGGRSGPGHTARWAKWLRRGHGVRAAVPLRRQRCRRPLRGAENTWAASSRSTTIRWA